MYFQGFRQMVENLTLKNGGVVKDVDAETRTVQLYASRFGNEDADGDVMVKGAYARSIQDWGPDGKDRIWHLVDHDYTKRVTKPTSIVEDDHGLLCESEIPDTTLGSDLLKLYETVGTSMEHSVGFQELRRDDDEQRRIVDVKLFEYSTVTWGANDQARAVELKTLDVREDDGVRDVCERHIGQLKSLLKEGMSAATAHRLEVQLAIFKRQLDALHAAERTARTAREQRESGDRAKDAEREASEKIAQLTDIAILNRKLSSL